MLFFILAKAQYERIDSLNSSLIETTTDEIRTEVYLEMSKIYSTINLDTSILYGKLSYDLANKNGWKKKQAEIQVSIGYTYLGHGDFDACYHNFIEAFEVANELKDTFSMANVSNAIGVAFWENNQNDIAIGHMQNAYDWAQLSKNKIAYEAALNNLGMISGTLGRNEQAIEYFKKSMAFAEKSNDWVGVAMGNMNIGVSYQGMEEYEKAIASFNTALSMKSKLEDKNLIALIYLNVADVLFAQQKHNKTLDACNNALAICKEFGYRDLRHDIVSIKVKSLLELKQFEQALYESQKAMKEIQASNSTYLLPDFEESLSKAHEGLGNYKEALLWQKKYSSRKDSLYETSRDAAIAEIEISHQTKEKEAENALLKQDKEMQEAMLHHRTMVASISVGCLLLLGVFSFLLFGARKKLKVMNNDLEGTVAIRTEALKKSNSELQQSNEELKRFAFIASHDLKEPLRNTGGFISLMKKRLKERNFESLGEYMTFVEKSNYQMVDLVDNILTYSQLDAKKSEEQVLVDLNEEVKEVSTLLQKIMSDKNALILCQPLPKVYCSPSLIKVVLKNLIENGIKYNEQDEPTIQISAVAKKSELKIIVSDNGIGISKDYQDRIFGMFTRLNNRSKYTGSGMGLAFCKKMLDSHGASITVESELGKGATFTVNLQAKVVNEDGGASFSLADTKEEKEIKIF